MRALELVGAVIAAACLVGGGLVVASSASALPGPDATGQLLLSTDPSPLGMHDLPPGGEVDWQVRAALDADTGSDLSLEVEAEGAMATDAGGLRLSIERCSAAWSGLACPAGDAAEVVPTAPIADAVAAPPLLVMHLDRTGVTHLLVRLTLPVSAGEAFVGTTASVRIVLTAAGEEATVGTDVPGVETHAPGALASTGVAVAGPALIGAGIVVAGVVIASLRRRREAAA
jgi:hypothetical protein